MTYRTPNNFAADNRWTTGNLNLPPTFQPPPYHHVTNFANIPPPRNFMSVNSNPNFDAKAAEHQKIDSMVHQPYKLGNVNDFDINQFQNSKQQKMINPFTPLPSVSQNLNTQNVNANQVSGMPIPPPNYPKPACQPAIANSDKNFLHLQHVSNFNSSHPNKQIPQGNVSFSERMPIQNSHPFNCKISSNNTVPPPYCNVVNVSPQQMSNTYIQSNIPPTCNVPSSVVQCPVPAVEHPRDSASNLQQIRFPPPPFMPTNNVNVRPFGNLMMVPSTPTYSQIPFPPPPPVATPSFASHVPTVLDPAMEKERLLSTFLQKFQKKKKDTTKTGPTVAEFRSILKAAFSVSKKLYNCRQNLSTLLHGGEEEWNAAMQRVQELKNLLGVCSLLSEPRNLSIIQKRLRTIKKKREMKARLKQEAVCARQKREQARDILHQEIDKWVDEIKEKNLKVKREIEMKKEVDKILSEVRRKIQEAKKTIEKLKVFEKLRVTRQMSAQQKGLFIAPDHSVVFEQKLDTYRSLLHQQVEVYEEEERTLRVMLEEEQEGQLEEEVQWRRERLKSLQKKKQTVIMQCLFGDTKDPLPEDPLYLFHQHQNAGNCSIKSLVQIRHHWDDHLAENGDSIPQQWVVPLPPNSSAWEAACQS